MIGDFLRALGQMGDRRFRSVLLRGVGLTVALFVALATGVFYLVDWAIPDTLTLPRIGELNWVDDFASGVSLLLMVVLSAFLMIPVASAFTSMFLDDVADAVEAEHYAHLPPAPRVPFGEAVRDGLSFLGVLVFANLAALVLYIFLAPFAPLIFLGLNGFLLGREYFQLVAMRRLGRAGARAARSRHAGAIWLAGTLMAVPLTVPVINLLVPVLGAATFTHLFHRWEASAPTEDAYG
jgi:CysZ protein